MAESNILEKLCAGKCAKTKPLTDFSKDKNRKDGRSAMCKSCFNDYARDYRKRPEVIERENVRRTLRLRESYGDFYIPLTFAEPDKQKALEGPEVSSKDKYTKSNKGRRAARAFTLRYKYGITIDDFHRLFEKQRRKCAICREKFNGYDSIHVDHCHVTKKVRGLLCAKCNKGLGHFNDDPNILRRAIRYLIRANPELHSSSKSFRSSAPE